jgi:hypothetical protein
MAGRIGSASPRPPPTSLPPARPVSTPPNTAAPARTSGASLTSGADTQLLSHSVSLAGHPVTPGGVDSYSLSQQTSGTTQRPPHEVGTRVHGTPQRVQYQHASAGLTHTQGDGTPGLHHQQLKAHAALGHATHDRTSQLGPVSVHTQAQASLFQAEAEAGLRLDTNRRHPQLILHGGASALSGARASVSGHVGRPHLCASVQAEASANAQASAQASAVFDPRGGNAFVRAGVSATAGASASAGGTAHLGPLVLSGKVGANAGVGYSASVGAGMQNGVVGAKVDVSAALGAGASASVGAGYDTTWRPHLASWAHAAPAGPQLNRLGNLGPQSAQTAAQAVANHPVPQPRLDRIGNLGPQSPQTAAQATSLVP